MTLKSIKDCPEVLECFVAEELVELFSVSFFQIVLFSVIGNYCHDKFSSFVSILRLFL